MRGPTFLSACVVVCVYTSDSTNGAWHPNFAVNFK